MNRRAWYLERQGGACYLANTSECQSRAGALSLDRATWDHVLPRASKPRGATSLVLLACAHCNTAKGAEPPTLGDVRVAMALATDWFSLPGAGGSPLLMAKLQKQVARFERDNAWQEEAQAELLAALAAA